MKKIKKKTIFCPYKERKHCTFKQHPKGEYKGRNLCKCKDPLKCPFYQYSHTKLKRIYPNRFKPYLNTNLKQILLM